MSHCLLKEQDIILFKFFSVSFIFFEIKKISKKKKKMRKKIFATQKISALNQCQSQTMSLSDNGRI